MNHYTREAINALSPIRVEALLAGQTVNMADVIAKQRGWNPLVVGEEMTVHYEGKEYVVRRTE